MNTCKLLFRLIGAGLAGSVIVSGAALAQDRPQAATPQAAAPQAQSSDNGCSFLGCWLKWHTDSQPEPQTQRSAAEGDPPAVAAPVRARPVHVVTIAADPAEMSRLKRLASALPKEKIKLVKLHEGAKSQADFAVATSLDAPRGDEAAQAKLFSEQLHILAGPAIKNVADLKGKVVSFGPDKSPGQAAARRAFEAMGVKVQETPLDVDNALDGLATGDVAAVVLLAPQPFERLTRVSAPGVHLIAWPEGVAPPEGASVSTIPATAYPTLAHPGEPIRTMSVDALLTISAKGSKQAAAKGFLKTLNHNSDLLAKHGFDLLKAEAGRGGNQRYASR